MGDRKGHPLKSVFYSIMLLQKHNDGKIVYIIVWYV